MADRTVGRTAPAGLAEKLAVRVAESGGQAKVVQQLSDPLHTASLRVNFRRRFLCGTESRYVGTTLRGGRSTGVADAQAVGDDGNVAIIARLTAYLG